MVSVCNPLCGKQTMFAILNYLVSYYLVQPNKLLRVIGKVMNHKSV